MKISFVFAMDENRAIGYKNRLPWHMPADLKHFKAVTLGKPVLMGRKTYDSIGRPLPERPNIIITRDRNYQVDGCDIYHSIDEAITALQHYDEVMVIGGSKIFEQMMSEVDCMYVTLIHAVFSADAYFPEWDTSEWQEVEREAHKADQDNKNDYTFITYQRNKPKTSIDLQKKDFVF